ncbi:MAG: flagellar biosynthetic protein FliR [Solirubrobacteraceae bacterium]
MSTTDLTTLIKAISSDHVVAFFLVAARVTPLFVIAPMFSSSLMLGRVKTIVGLGLTIGLTPFAARGQHLPTQPLAVLGLMLAGLLVGFALAYAVSAVFAAVQGAGVLADSVSGFSFGATIDPVNGNQGGALTNIYSFVGLAVFLAIGGDAWMLRGIEATFRLVPIGRGPDLDSLVANAVQMFGTVFIGAVEVAAPILLALVITDIGFGMVAKVMPQLNVFAIGFPVKIGVGVLVVMASLPFIGGWLTSQLDASVGAALHSLRIA